MKPLFTIFGAQGFIGSALCQHLIELDHEVNAVGRHNWPKEDTDLGHIVFAAGMTSRFLELPFETVETQVNLPSQILRNYRYTSFLYLSSARLYKSAQHTSEDAAFTVSPTDPADIYTLTKTAGECLCFTQDDPAVRVVRLSNVYGDFKEPIVSLASMLKDAATTGSVAFKSSSASAKDYVSLIDVAALLPKIALHGKERIYNIASGRTTNNQSLADAFAALGVKTEFAADGQKVIDPEIEIKRLSREFGAPKRGVIEDLELLLRHAKEQYKSTK